MKNLERNEIHQVSGGNPLVVGAVFGLRALNAYLKVRKAKKDIAAAVAVGGTVAAAVKTAKTVHYDD